MRVVAGGGSESGLRSRGGAGVVGSCGVREGVDGSEGRDGRVPGRVGEFEIVVPVFFLCKGGNGYKERKES